MAELSRTRSSRAVASACSCSCWRLVGLKHHQAFAALGYPSFRHFVRLCVHPSGRIEGFVIGKDDPLGRARPF